LLELSGFTEVRLQPTRRPLRVRLLTARPALPTEKIKA